MIIYGTRQIQLSGTSLISSIEIFFDDMRNLRFALSTDVMNPFGHMSSSHRVSLVLLSIYDLPPWLCNKRKYMMMSVLI